MKIKLDPWMQTEDPHKTLIVHIIVLTLQNCI